MFDAGTHADSDDVSEGDGDSTDSEVEESEDSEYSGLSEDDDDEESEEWASDSDEGEMNLHKVSDDFRDLFEFENLLDRGFFYLMEREICWRRYQLENVLIVATLYTHYVLNVIILSMIGYILRLLFVCMHVELKASLLLWFPHMNFFRLESYMPGR